MRILTIILLIITLATTCKGTTSHQCQDTTHISCDGSCECDGMECEKN